MDKETDEMVDELATGIIQRHGAVKGMKVLAVLGCISKLIESISVDEELLRAVMEELPEVLDDIRILSMHK